MANPHWLLRFTLFTILLTGHGTAMSADMTKFDWNATESAPDIYPMKIINGTFRYHGAPNGEGLYVPSGGRINGGWGLMISSHITGPDLKPLPDKLDITFFSYMEDTFYRGSFDLPYDKILSLFQTAAEQDKNKDKDRRPDYSLMVGVAPGGTVAVWLRGDGIKEVFFGQAKKVDLDLAKEFGVPITNRKEYVEKSLKGALTPEILASIRKNGIPFQQWAQYRTLYHWVPTFPVSHPPEDFAMGFFNGESGRFNFPLEPVFTAHPRPVPNRIEFHYAVNGVGMRDFYILHFDEGEMLAAFARLGAHQQPLQLEFDPKAPKELTQVRLRNDKEVIQLKKFTVKKID